VAQGRETEVAEPPRVESSTVYDRLWDTGLPTVLALARRDLSALLRAPATYAFGAAAVLPATILGYVLPVLAGDPITMGPIFSWVAITMAVITPLCTARLLADEQRSGTLDLLLSSPVRFRELVLAKWLAGLVLFAAATTFTLVIVAVLAVAQPGVDTGAILAGYAGVLLLGAAWVAVGLLAASLTRSRVVAALVGIAALLALQYLAGTAAGFLSPPLSDLLDYASAANRAQSFDQGQVALRDVVYFATLTVGALVLTARVLESRRWR
jgi:ABC-2 type transport system permease protein